jgi:hypothetical protein
MLSSEDQMRLARARHAHGDRTLVSLADASKISGIPYETLRGWAARRILPTYHPGRVDLGEVDRLRDTCQTHPPGCPLPWATVTAIRHVGSGLTNREIGTLLGCSEDAVSVRLSKAMSVTGARSRSHLVALALREGWVSIRDLSLPAQEAVASAT